MIEAPTTLSHAQHEMQRLRSFASSQVIGQDPNLVRPGEVLYIPPVAGGLRLVLELGDIAYRLLYLNCIPPKL